MRKHSVDDLFKRKLSDIEKTPSSAAWEKIQAKTKKERRLVGWVWYAAASIVIALMAGYVIWNSERSNIESIADGKKLANVQVKPETTLTTQEDSLPEIKSDVKDTQMQDRELATMERKQKTGLLEQSSKQNVQPVESSEKVGIQLPEKLVAIDVEVREESKAALPSVDDFPKIEEAIASKISPEPTRTIVVAVQTNDQEEPKTSKFSRVFRQLKNARAGERVDWEEVGFNPKSLVAKVDDRLRNGEDKVSEKYHNLKEKTKL
ncbi:hypothetical protein LXM25_13910 [Dyadobacter sp. LJ53]|uniref:hypothetical protein n=1 Tax=Dyadobacter chenwenxiniae TaxID=2906456 RepID=UPI001F1A8CEA|nr:hypothetical protein [Dyadobacter chenwenxiniae]MCF0051160.1 hypothetical protein [Dyadobacter chenwenxiniae]